MCCGECVQCYRSWEVISVCAVGSVCSLTVAGRCSVCVLWGVCAVLP